MKKIFNILKSENGGPLLETTIDIFVALIYIGALCALGAVVIRWVGGATSAVYSLNL